MTRNHGMTEEKNFRSLVNNYNMHSFALNCVVQSYTIRLSVHAVISKT